MRSEQNRTERNRAIERETSKMGLCFGCFGVGDKRMSKEEERIASEEARAKAAEAAQKRFIFIHFLIFPFSLFQFHEYSIVLFYHLNS